MAEACCGEMTTDEGFPFPEGERATCLAALDHPLLPEVLPIPEVLQVGANKGVSLYFG